MHKILIIEDDLVIAKGLQNHLCQWGYQVGYVTDFKAVLKTLCSILAIQRLATKMKKSS